MIRKVVWIASCNKLRLPMLQQDPMVNFISKYPLLASEMEMDPPGGFFRFIQLKDDASFLGSLFPGRYNFSVRIGHGKQMDTIKIQDNILIEENKTTTVQIP